MHPLVFSTIWLLGSAAAGDKEARRALLTIPPGLIADLCPGLMSLLDAISGNNVQGIKEAVFALSGVTLGKGERCTAGIIRELAKSELDWAIRVSMASSVLMPPDKLAERLEEVAGWLRKDKSNGPQE